tara:strand:+ start:4917 stop:5444 length:528 start_codon:yes stop_codon:yes gene_type:complete
MSTKLTLSQSEIQKALVLYANHQGFRCTVESANFDFLAKRTGNEGVVCTMEVNPPELRYMHDGEAVINVDLAVKQPEKVTVDESTEEKQDTSKEESADDTSPESEETITPEDASDEKQEEETTSDETAQSDPEPTEASEGEETTSDAESLSQEVKEAASVETDTNGAGNSSSLFS